jgi:hypothetical protein
VPRGNNLPSADSDKLFEYPEQQQLGHCFIDGGSVNSEAFNFISEMLGLGRLIQRLSPGNSIVRMKANLLLRSSIVKSHQPHYDTVGRSTSLIYYVNDSDGDTVFFDKSCQEDPSDLTEIHRETPVAGDIIVFDGTRYHASSPPVNSPHRAVINIVTQ